MKTITITRFAVLFKHTRGWTVVCICDSAAKAQIYVRDHKKAFDAFDWKIRPCKVGFTLPDSMAAGFK